MIKHNKTLIFFVIIFCVILASVIFISRKQEFSLTNNAVTRGNSEKNVLIELDTDNDGLYDWEEELWKTDPRNSDSDNDKTPDGAEVKMGRNPAISGPNDLLSSTISESVPKNTEISANEDLTPTERLGRELFAKYLALKQSGALFDEKSTETFVSEIVQNMANNFSYKTYSLNDIPLSSSNDENAIKSYGNQLGNIIKSNSVKTENELIVWGRFSDSGNIKELEVLSPIINSYQSILNQELALKVPKIAREAHLDFINSLSFVLSSLKSMRAAKNSDPLTILTVMERHIGSVKKLKVSIVNLQEVFKKNNVDFAQEEAGYMFLHGI